MFHSVQLLPRPNCLRHVAAIKFKISFFSSSKKEFISLEGFFHYFVTVHWHILVSTPTNTQSVCLFSCCFFPLRQTRNTLLQYSVWFTTRVEVLHLSRCVHPLMSALWKIKTTDLCYTAHNDTGMRYIKPKNLSFLPRLLLSTSKHTLSSSIFFHPICQRLKKQRPEICTEEVACTIMKNSIWKCLE